MMKTEKTTWSQLLCRAAVIAVLASVFFTASCGNKEAHEKKSDVTRPAKIMTLGEAAATSQRSFPGKVQASQEVNLSFEVSGRLVELPIKEGDAVKKGQLLAKLDPTDFQNRVDKQRAVRDNAEVDFHRWEGLFASGAVAQADYDQRKTAFETADADLKIAEKALRDTTLQAPFDGFVAAKSVDNFQYVQAKQDILSLQDVSQIEIKVDVPEDLVARVKQEGIARVYARFESVSDREFDVTIKKLGIQANRQTQTFPITLTMPAPKDVRILPGMTATATLVENLPAAEAGGRFTIPEASVWTDEKGTLHVWVVDKSTMRATKREIKTGLLTGSSIAVLDGLKPGDMIVTAGVAHMRENMKVRSLKDKRGGGK
jgi:RND family efflux transporter MFP subunit